jgi:hypothetical protein
MGPKFIQSITPREMASKLFIMPSFSVLNMVASEGAPAAVQSLIGFSIRNSKFKIFSLWPYGPLYLWTLDPDPQVSFFYSEFWLLDSIFIPLVFIQYSKIISPLPID